MKNNLIIIVVAMTLVLFTFVKAEELNQKLWQTVRNGTLAEVEQLLEQGADPNTHGESYGDTCLNVASFNGNIDKVKILLKYGADINGVHNGKGNIIAKGENALESSILGYIDNTDCEKVSIFLVEKGVNIFKKNKFGFNMLMFASREGMKELIQLLINKGLDVNSCTTDNHSALSIACLKCQTEVVKVLLANGAKTDYKITEGKYKGYTALKIAKENNCVEIIKLLKNNK